MKEIGDTMQLFQVNINASPTVSRQNEGDWRHNAAFIKLLYKMGHYFLDILYRTSTGDEATLFVLQ